MNAFAHSADSQNRRHDLVAHLKAVAASALTFAVVNTKSDALALLEARDEPRDPPQSQQR